MNNILTELRIAKDHFDSAIARDYKTARERFATVNSNRNAATLLRAAEIAAGADLIDEEEQVGALYDVIEYLER